MAPVAIVVKPADSTVMAAGRKGFRVCEMGRRNRDRRSEVAGRETGICRGEGSYHRGAFGEREKVRVGDRAVEEREFGELWSGSEDGVSPRDAVDGVSGPANKKRKFSPILWDRDDGNKAGAVCFASEDYVQVDPSISPCPPMPQGCMQLRDAVNWKSENGFAYADDRRCHVNDVREIGQLEEEDGIVVTRNVLSSRWANADDVLDEDDEDGGAVAPKRKGTPVRNSLKKPKKSPSPELGEILPESSEGAASRSSESELGRRDYMIVDGGSSDLDVEAKETIVESLEPVRPLQRSINMLQGCRSVYEFERLNKISEGTYGVVYRARDKKSGEIVALKQVKMAKEREGFPLTALREINILLSFSHPSIVDVKEVVVGDCLDKIYMVMEYMDHDLKSLMESMKQPFSQSEVKCLMLQLLEGVKYLHDNWVLHRDLKTSNLLFNNRGELKICDFGLSRQYGSPLKPYTPLVVTLWYRAPELLLGTKQYSTAIDMWSLGCIMAELLAKEPLFNGKTEFDQLDKIFKALGTPNEKIWPGLVNLPSAKFNFVKQPYNSLREKFPPTSFTGCPTLSERGFDLLNKLLTYDPDKRITAEAALAHEWFTEVPLPKSKDCMPTFPAKNA